MSFSDGSTGSVLAADADARRTSSSGSNRSRSSCPAGHPLAQHPAVPVRSLQGLEIDGVPTHLGCTRVDGPDAAVLRAFRSALDTTTPAGDRARGSKPSPGPSGTPDPGVSRSRRGPRRRAPTARGPGPALRVVDGVATGLRERRDRGAPRCRGRARNAEDWLGAARDAAPGHLAAGARGIAPGQRRPAARLQGLPKRQSHQKGHADSLTSDAAYSRIDPTP